MSKIRYGCIEIQAAIVDTDVLVSVDVNDFLQELEAKDVVKHFGAEDLLAQMSTHDIAEFLKTQGYTVTDPGDSPLTEIPDHEIIKYLNDMGCYVVGEDV